MLLQYKLKVSRSQSSEAQQRAEEASSSYKTASEQLSEAQEAAAEAASTAAAEISDLQVYKATLHKVNTSCMCVSCFFLQVSGRHVFLSMLLG